MVCVSGTDIPDVVEDPIANGLILVFNFHRRQDWSETLHLFWLQYAYN